MIVASIAWECSYSEVLSVIGCGVRPSNQSKRYTSISNALCSAVFIALRKLALSLFIFGVSLSLEYFLCSATGLLRRN